jgi:hypothetical protein
MTHVVTTGETALWRAVVLQAFKDATLGTHGARANRKPRRPSATLREHACAARDWLLGKGSGFLWVCDMADLDPDAVAKTAREVIATAAYATIDHGNLTLPLRAARSPSFHGCGGLMPPNDCIAP